MSEVTELLVARQATLLAEGGWRYTPRQLYYAVAAAVEPNEIRVAAAQLALGAALFLGGVIGGGLATPYLAPVAVVGMIVFALGVQARRRERDRPDARPQTLSWSDFERDHVEPLRHPGAGGLPGLLIAAEENGQSDQPGRPSDGVLVCDLGETAAMIAANAEAAGLEVMVLGEAGADVGALAGRTVYALHDADQSGCELPLRLLRTGAARVVDLGLRPSQVVGRVPVITTAPRVVGPELGSLLSADEVVWLANGRRVELAVARPASLVPRVTSALDGAPGVALAAELVVSRAPLLRVPIEPQAAALADAPATAVGR